MIVLTDNNFGRHLYLPVKPSGLVTEYGFNCLPFDIMSNNVRMSPASNKTAGSLLGSFHKSYLTSSQRNISHLQPMATSASLVGTMYSGGQYHGIGAYTDRYSTAYTISPSRTGDIIKYAAQSLTMGPLYITDSNYSTGSHGTSYYANFEYQYCYALRCTALYHMSINHIASYYVILVKGTKSEILNDSFGFTQIITSGSFTADYDPVAATLTAPCSVLFTHFSDASVVFFSYILKRRAPLILTWDELSRRPYQYFRSILK